MVDAAVLGLSVLAAQATPQTVLKPLGHHELLLILLELSLLLFAARTAGEIMQRLRLPPVVGELLAGVLLGPSVLGALLPGFQAQIFPRSQAQADLLSVVSWLGVLFLLIVTGLETDLNLILRKGKTALSISLGGIVVPFLSGILLGYGLPDSFLADPNHRLVFSLFMATAMSISAVPVIAKVLIDLQLIRRDIGQITLAAGMTDDTIGWILLSIVAGLAGRGQIDPRGIFISVSGAVIFLGLAFTLGRSLMAQILRWVDDYIGGPTASLSALLVLSFAAAALTHRLGIEAALGAFVTGILAGQSPRFSREAGRTLELITMGFLAPIFFAAAGLKVNLLQLLQPDTFLVGMLVLAIACIGKFVGAYLGARGGGLSHWEGLALGSGMNARGAMEIIVATIGLSLGVLNPQMYSIVVMVAIVTSLMAPPLLRWTLSHVQMGEEEAYRLTQEAMARRSFIKNVRRVLIPTRGGLNVQLAAQLVSHLAYQNPIEVTTLFVLTQGRHPQPATPNELDQNPRAKVAIGAVADEIELPPGQTLARKVMYGDNLASIILGEARRGYDLVVLGATEQQGVGGSLFNFLVDQVVQDAPCPIMIVKSGLEFAEGETAPLICRRLSRILVPTSGTEASRCAVEVASTIAAHSGAVVSLLHVVNQPQQHEYLLFEQQPLPSVLEMTHQILELQAALATDLGAQVQTVIREGIPEREILNFAQEYQVDLIVLGTSVRMVTGRVFFGHRVDAILSKTACPVAVVSIS
jgi:Kef-type K+ transport system membrane component KefB/nucleotide-binding universal stress UspA family protein